LQYITVEYNRGEIYFDQVPVFRRPVILCKCFAGKADENHQAGKFYPLHVVLILKFIIVWNAG
jgi:hypothetical protein